MARLPIPGSDEGKWGDILNEYLSVEHNADGTQKPLPQSKVTNLTSDLATKVDTTRTINSQPLSADVVLTKNDIGLPNIDNTSDANKPVSIAQQAALTAHDGNASAHPALRTRLDAVESDRGVGKGTYASRPVSGPYAGYVWVQTDAAGGNLAGTATRWNGSAWEVVGFALPQLAPIGLQSDNWITPHTQIVTLPAGQPLVPGANGIYMRLVRPRKTITLASMGIDTGSTVCNYELAIYRLDGNTLTRLGSTGTRATTGVANTFRRDALTATVQLDAGSTYYFAITADAAMSILSDSGTTRWSDFIGGVAGDAPYLYAAAALAPGGASWLPMPTSIDLGAVTMSNSTSIAHILAGHAST